MIDAVEHNFETKEEAKKVAKWIDYHVGIEYEITYDDNGEEGSMVIFGMEAEEFEAFMDFLQREGYINA